MHILLIITPYLPSQTPNTLRWHPLVLELVKQQQQVTVLTTKHSSCGALESLEQVNVYRVGHNSLQDYLYNILQSKKRRHETGTAHPESSLLSILLQKLIDKTWRNSYWPDGSKLFLKPGILKGKEILKSEGISHVISVGLPFTCHWIACSLKAFKPDIHWHMDIEDPFCYSDKFWVNNFKKYRDKNIAAEKEAFEWADTISVTNSIAKEKYATLFPNQQNKLRVIPPLYSAQQKGRYDMILDKTKIHLAYFGSFYGGVRSPLLFLKFLKFLNDTDPSLKEKLQFHFIGQMDRVNYPFFKTFPELRDFMVFHGFKDRGQTNDAMNQVDILLNFGNTTTYHLPSKVVDYLAVGKPILNIKSILEDSTEVFFSTKDVDICNLLLDETQFKQNAEALIRFVFTNHPDKNNNQTVEAFSVEKICEQYLRNLNGQRNTGKLSE